mmetsp:Transcript_63253/g.126866  ORF Transcript_63253/g.126866 Transcript_63253/m.126866 type:complete len:118 (-) Transcript_63253:292-645(-)
MSDEVKLKLIFANDTNTQEIVIPVSSVVRDVKKSIMDNYWPASLAAIEKVERLRLFAGGKELGGKDVDDTKSLRDFKLVGNPNYPTPVHVQPVMRSATTNTDRETSGKPSQCLCTLL